MQLSKHFSLDEFVRSQTATRNHIENLPNEQQIKNMQLLCGSVLEFVRRRFGVVYVSSGFRCPELNEMIGSVDTSQHTKGEAADIVVGNMPSLAVAKFIRDTNLPFHQLIMEGAWVHVSIKDGHEPLREVLTAHFKPHQPTTYSRGLEA